jgi:mannosyltransferase
MKLFGDSEFSIRFPSLIFGVLSIGAIYQVGKLLFDARKGLIAAFLLALSTFHIYYSQEARPYSLTVFLALLSFSGFIKCHQEWNLNRSIGYVVSSTLLLYSHVIGIFFIAAQNLYMLTLYLFFKNDKSISLKHWLILQGSVGLLFLPWVPIFMTRSFDQSRSDWLPIPTLLDILGTLRTYAGKNLLKLCILLGLASIITMKGITFSGGLRSLFKSSERNNPKIALIDIKQNWLLLLSMSMPIVIPCLLSYILPPLYHNRYTIIGSLSFYLLVASGIGNLRSAAMRSLVIAVFLAVGSINALAYYRSTAKWPWRKVEQYIEQCACTEDMLIFDSKCRYDKIYKYYSDSNKPQTIVTSASGDLIDTDLLEKWSALAKDHERVWVILTKKPEKPNPIIQVLERTHAQVCALQFTRIRLHLFQLQGKDVKHAGSEKWHSQAMDMGLNFMPK